MHIKNLQKILYQTSVVLQRHLENYFYPYGLKVILVYLYNCIPYFVTCFCVCKLRITLIYAVILKIFVLELAVNKTKLFY